IDDDHVIRELGGCHSQAELLLHRGVQVGWSLRVVGRWWHDRSGSSKLPELRLIWSPFQLEIVSVLELGFIHNWFVHHTGLHPGGKIRHGLVPHREISQRPEKEGTRIILGGGTFGHLGSTARYPDY